MNELARVEELEEKLGLTTRWSSLGVHHGGEQLLPSRGGGVLVGVRLLLRREVRLGVLLLPLALGGNSRRRPRRFHLGLRLGLRWRLDLDNRLVGRRRFGGSFGGGAAEDTWSGRGGTSSGLLADESLA